MFRLADIPLETQLDTGVFGVKVGSPAGQGFESYCSLPKFFQNLRFAGLLGKHIWTFQGVSHEDPTDSPEHPSRHAWVVAQILTHPDHP